ncbi:unnamed protein product [Bursaphelenchus xylophilus]|uniref:(pine wood nematode) hypothetical protein n=1 Tax=Bursaphelenchus xylophilus TaxID=6326 RepID=A0A1I7SAD0_BURXY|nr:unnamed protein product [Bursaphelenchus xylophilus]CAG9084054.1 unnamed protein product [Bursaphelenchus xylophilus]
MSNSHSPILDAPKIPKGESFDEINSDAVVKPLCQNCGSSFSNLNEFIDHMRLTHLKPSETERKCRFCDQIFSDNQERLIHLSEHLINTKAEFTCHKCDKKFFNSVSFKQHFAVTHTDVIFRCQLCLMTFTDQNIYQDHLVVHMNTIMIFNCNLCGVNVQSQEMFLTHVQMFHEKDVPSQLNQGGSGEKTIVRNLKCFVCDLRFVDDVELDHHRLFDHCKVPKSDRCAVCRVQLEDINDFLTHSKNHSKDPTEVSCAICKQMVRSSETLKRHGEYHLEKDPGPSPEIEKVEETREGVTEEVICHCGQKFEDPQDLQTHSLEHLQQVTSEHLFNLRKELGPFVCPKCPKIFPSMSALQGHSHIHVKRRHPCDKCKQCFSTTARLIAHRKRHLGERDVKCQICDQCFERNELLTNHMKIHEMNIQLNPILQPN